MFKNNTLPFGLILGIVAPLVPFLLFFLVMHHDKTLVFFIEEMYRTKVFSPLISLCVLINLALFFLLLNRNNYPAARGVILATLLYAFLITYIKFFT